MKPKKPIQSPASRKMYRLFRYKEFSFDPGLWKMILTLLPDGYSIPDPQFTSQLKQYNEELAQIDP